MTTGASDALTAPPPTLQPHRIPLAAQAPPNLFALLLERRVASGREPGHGHAEAPHGYVKRRAAPAIEPNRSVVCRGRVEHAFDFSHLGGRESG